MSGDQVVERLSRDSFRLEERAVAGRFRTVHERPQPHPGASQSEAKTPGPAVSTSGVHRSPGEQRCEPPAWIGSMALSNDRSRSLQPTQYAEDVLPYHDARAVHPAREARRCGRRPSGGSGAAYACSSHLFRSTPVCWAVVEVLRPGGMVVVNSLDRQRDLAFEDHAWPCRVELLRGTPPRSMVSRKTPSTWNLRTRSTIASRSGFPSLVGAGVPGVVVDINVRAVLCMRRPRSEVPPGRRACRGRSRTDCGRQPRCVGRRARGPGCRTRRTRDDRGRGTCRQCRYPARAVVKCSIAQHHKLARKRRRGPGKCRLAIRVCRRRPAARGSGHARRRGSRGRPATGAGSLGWE